MTSTQALTTLLTTESLLFAVFSVALAFGSSGLTSVVSAGFARSMVKAVAVVLTVLGIGACTAWIEVFVGACTHGFTEWAPAFGIAVGVAAQPVFAWILVCKVRP